MITGLDHVTIAVRSLASAITAQTELLGKGPSFRGEHPGLGTEGALFALGNTAIELVAPKLGAEESEGLRARLAQQGEGLVAIAFAVEDAAQASRALRAKGLRATPPEEGQALAADGRVRTYRTVELSQRLTRGISVHLVERPSLQDLRDAQQGPDDAVEALDHLVIRSSDPAAAIALYGDGLGARLALDAVVRGLRMLFFRTGGVTLEIVTDASRGAEDAFYGLAYRVADLEGARARLRASGHAASEIRPGRKPGTHVVSVDAPVCGVRSLLIFDPSRTRIGT